MTFIRPKTHPLFTDASLNGTLGVAHNVYEACWLAGAKLIASLRTSTGAVRSPLLLFLAIKAAVNGIIAVIRFRLRAIGTEAAQPAPESTVSWFVSEKVKKASSS